MAAAAYAYALPVSVEMHNLNLHADQKACFDCIDTAIQSVFIFIYILKQKPINLEQPRAMRSIMILLL